MKEIIIDGVKVEECSYYNKDNTPYCCEVWDNECEAQNCYYKQLKRLEKLYNDLINRVCLENYERLEQENETLKANYHILETQANNIITVYKQTLDAIKEIAEELSCKHPEECFENKPDWNGEVYGCDVADNWKNTSELATCPSKLASAILQIITKAEEE